MVDYPNFYQQFKEAEMRIANTIVMYDNEPHYVYCLANHKPDGIFRVYMEKLNSEGKYECHYNNIPYALGPTHRGPEMDKYLDNTKNTKIVRKMMNSPSFNKFRPFPLGMVNRDGRTFYLQRSPTRHTQQGLLAQAIASEPVSLEAPTKFTRSIGSGGYNWDNPSLYDVIMGIYPTFSESLIQMRSKECTNQSVAFSRDFALLRGPIDLLFLAYKSQIIGLIPEDTLPTVTLSSSHKHLKELVGELKAFKKII